MPVPLPAPALPPVPVLLADAVEPPTPPVPLAAVLPPVPAELLVLGLPPVPAELLAVPALPDAAELAAPAAPPVPDEALVIPELDEPDALLVAVEALLPPVPVLSALSPHCIASRPSETSGMSFRTFVFKGRPPNGLSTPLTKSATSRGCNDLVNAAEFAHEPAVVLGSDPRRAHGAT